MEAPGRDPRGSGAESEREEDRLDEDRREDEGQGEETPKLGSGFLAHGLDGPASPRDRRYGDGDPAENAGYGDDTPRLRAGELHELDGRVDPGYRGPRAGARRLSLLHVRGKSGRSPRQNAYRFELSFAVEVERAQRGHTLLNDRGHLTAAVRGKACSLKRELDVKADPSGKRSETGRGDFERRSVARVRASGENELRRHLTNA